MELYIHIPFCVRKCDYCDFLSFPCGNEIMGRNSELMSTGIPNGDDIKCYIDALCHELESISDVIEAKPLTSVFIGGGTPSVLSVELMRPVLETVRKLRHADTDFEFTIECNPGTLTDEKLALYRQYGVNRISLGLQSVNDCELKALGRIHSYDQFLDAYSMVREAGFTNVNIDLISAIPGQTVQSWEKTLRTVAELNPEHISAYSLIIEPGTPFYYIYGDCSAAESTDTDCVQSSVKKKNISGTGQPVQDVLLLPDEDSEREMYKLTARVLAEYGYERYEISNYAKQGFECRHNIGYWTGEEYLGVGIGSASYISYDTAEMLKACGSADCLIQEQHAQNCEAVRYTNTTDLSAYGTKLKENVEHLSEEDMMSEYIILHLRLTKGLLLSDFYERFEADFESRYAQIISKYTDLDLIEKADGYMRLTEAGLDVSNVIMAEFI